MYYVVVSILVFQILRWYKNPFDKSKELFSRRSVWAYQWRATANRHWSMPSSIRCIHFGSKSFPSMSTVLEQPKTNVPEEATVAPTIPFEDATLELISSARTKTALMLHCHQSDIYSSFFPPKSHAVNPGRLKRTTPPKAYPSCPETKIPSSICTNSRREIEWICSKRWSLRLHSAHLYSKSFFILNQAMMVLMRWDWHVMKRLNKSHIFGTAFAHWEVCTITMS